MSDYVATTTFDALPLSEELRKGIADRGYTAPTPVQAAVLQPILDGKDLIVRSKTGTGKTAAFGIPLLERIPAGTRKASALVLCNTRELALQVAQEIEALGKHKDLRVVAIYGGAGMKEQTDALHAGAEVIVGTPGRVYDHIQRGNLKLRDTRIAVLDEADEMLGAGFYEEVTRILDHLPNDRQTLLFSATVPPDIEQLANKYLRNPETILLSGDVFTVEHIQNVLYHLVDQYPKPRNLLYLIEREDPESAIVFCNLRTDTELVANVLNRNGFDAEMLNGDLPQKERERVMARVKRGELRFMVATDIAARGIDISDLSHVINYSLPEDPAVYLHRVGRTGRIGKKGTAISLVSGAELNTLSALEKKYGINFETRKLPTPDEARELWTGKHMRELREAMQQGHAFEAFLPLAQDLMARDEGKVLLAYALRYFFMHHRMEKAALRATGEKLLESHAVEKVHKEQKEQRRKKEREQRKPRLERESPPPAAPASAPAPTSASGEAPAAPAAPVDRVKLYVEQGAEHGWDSQGLLAALSEAAGQPRETALAADVKPRYSYVLVRPDVLDAYLALSGKPLKEKPLRLEVARPRRK
jgi:ATP-dependent RNA helicase DeaD